jgi:hypothetical protein
MIRKKKALLGIQNSKGFYTIIGEHSIYYLTSLGKRGEISHKEFTRELEENGYRIGKGYLKLIFRYKSIVLSNGDKVWLHNANTMFSLWSVIIWLEEEERKSVFMKKKSDAPSSS